MYVETETADFAVEEFRESICDRVSVFGGLVYFSSLRDEAGRYHHAGLAAAFDEDEADRIIRAAHEQAFAEWLSLSLERQKSDIDLYLSQFAPPRRQALFRYWTRIEPHRGLVPERTEGNEHALYLADFDVLLRLLVTGHGAAGLISD